MDSADKPKKTHKKKHAGVKARKKKEKQTGKVDKHNPRAFTFSGGTKSVQKRVQFTLDRQAKKEHVPKIDKTPEVPPPFIVVVQGPPGVGKTTLIESLIRHYSKQRLLQMRGPITLVSGRQRRITIVECPQDMPAMLDLAKVADLALILIDASYGFELETFEFINILQVHGFPRVIGVLTHLDKFKDTKQLRKVKKTMKHRFWTEIYDGAKLFYLSGLQYGRYHRVEVQNLARFIAVQKGSILSWRQSHPYMLALRWEDHTDAVVEDGAPRRLDLYGYVYGGRLREGSQVHLSGVGDFVISALKSMADPCPPPAEIEAERRKAKGGSNGKPKQKNVLRSLAERHRAIYAPGSDVGSITVDSEAMYIQLAQHQVGFTQREGEDVAGMPEAVKMVRALQGGDGAMDQAAASRPQLRLVGKSMAVLSDEPAMNNHDMEIRERRPVPDSAVAVQPERGSARKKTSAGGHEEENQEETEDEEDEDEDGGEDDDSEDEDQGGEEGNGDDGDDDAAHRERILQRARERFSQKPRLELVIYGSPAATKAKSTSSTAGPVTHHEESKIASAGPTDHATLSLFDDEEAEGTAERETQSVDLLGNLGDIHGLDTLRMLVLPGGEDPWDDDRKEDLKSRKFITGGWSSAEENSADEKDNNDAAEEATADAPEGRQNEGDGGHHNAAGEIDENFTDSFPIATFVRVRLEDVPAACVAEFRRERPIILGGLLPGETRMGMVQVRVKRHRWHPKVLKSGDPVLLSVGWRRFQTLPTFSLEDRGEKRMRYLKYTLEHAHCTMTSYGPMVPPNTGVLAFRSFGKVGHFRVCATGGVLESAPNFQVMKKLKLVGEPYRIFRNTAFIKNMFSSDLEVSKYAHTKIQTVSGIRGEIKKAEGTRGNFRAAFEDRILLSDLVVCKCWIGVSPKQFYHPVVDVAAWRPARLIGELRATKGIAVPHDPDSAYGPQHVRAERKFHPLKIPKSLEASLPFKTKPKNQRKAKVNPLRKQAAVVSTQRERDINSLLVRLQTVRNEKHRIRLASNAKKKILKEKREAFIQDKREEHKREAKKKRYVKEGKQEERRRKAMKLE